MGKQISFLPFVYYYITLDIDVLHLYNLPMPDKKAIPISLRAQRLTERQLIPLAQVLGWEEPDPYDNKTVVAFLRKLIDHCYDLLVEQKKARDEERERHIAACRLVAAYAEGLPETPNALLPAIEIAKQHASS